VTTLSTNAGFATGSTLLLDNATAFTQSSAIVNANGGANTLNVTKIGVGTLTLAAANTFSGKLTVGGGAVSASSLNSVSGGTASSSLGAPITIANGTIDLGAGATTGSIIYTGTGETTDRVLNLSGTTGGGAIDQSGTGVLRFNSSITAAGGAKGLVLLGSTAGTGVFAGNLVNGSGTVSLTKNGLNTWTLLGTNTYTGGTTVAAGTLHNIPDRCQPGGERAVQLADDRPIDRRGHRADHHRRRLHPDGAWNPELRHVRGHAIHGNN
jgi:autotransporter-associated beta strand protein